MNTFIRSLLLSSALLAPSALAQPHAGDVDLDLVNGRIATFDANGPQRVFAAEMGELAPGFTIEPGFDSAPGTFPPGASITFSIPDALRAWNGSDFSQPAPAPLEVAFSTLSVLTPPPGQTAQGFPLAVGSNGQWHRHYEFSLTPPFDSGVFLLSMRLEGSAPGMDASEVFWIVFNNGADEPTHDAAIDWVRDNLLPPACDPDLNQDGNADQDDVAYLIDVIGGGPNPAGIDPDFNQDGNSDQDDLSALVAVIAGAPCPE
jgi:hypothetical protein